VTVIEEVVGIFDAGRSLDRAALSSRQKDLLDGLVGRRGTPLARPETRRAPSLALA
jgi:hypothetical protein